MRALRVRNGIFGLLIVEAVVFGLATAAFILSLFIAYTRLIYIESSETLNQFTIGFDTRLATIEAQSFEILSNKDVQANMMAYLADPASLAAYTAANDLYTQLFTRWAIQKDFVAMTFVFNTGRRVTVGDPRIPVPDQAILSAIVSKAYEDNGAIAWTTGAVGENTVTLYRLIRDISGSGFKPLGVLLIHCPADYLLRYAPATPEKYRGEIVVITGDQILTRSDSRLHPDSLLALDTTDLDYRIRRIENQNYLVASRLSQHSSWTLIYALSTNVLLAGINRLNFVYFASLGILLVITTSVGYVFAKAVSNPIVRLARTMQTMEGRHDLQTMRTVPAVGVPIEEVEQLTSDFRQLMLRIDALIDEDISKQVLLADMRYKSLQQQINPHFLYNTLETVNWKAIEHGETEISVIVRSLSGLLRSAIGGPDTITVAEDLRIAEDYITIQKIRFEERLDYVADVPAEALRGVIPHLTIQPIVENCVTHNLEKNAGVCRIRLAARIEEGQLCIVVEDNGKGIDPDHVRRVLSGQVPTSESGIGLKNIDERIKLIFGEDYGIVVENRLDEAGGILGTRVCISLPSPPRRERDFTTPAGPAGGIS